MPLQLIEQNGGQILAVTVTGKLTRADYVPLVAAFARLVAQHGKLRLLVDLAGFHGWEAGAAWTDFKLGAKHFADIERLAIVGETKWQHVMAEICRPFTLAAVRYFDHTEAATARNWLEEA